MKTPSLKMMRGMLAARVKAVIDVTPHIDLRPDFRKCKANVLVLHGLKENIYSRPFHDVIEGLYKAHYHVVAFDFPNHGINVADEKKRGLVEGFWRWVDTTSVFAYWILISEKWGAKPTYVLGYSLGALDGVHLLQKKFLVRRGVAGLIQVAPPFSVDHNVSESARRWLPYLKPFRKVAKKVIPNYPVAPPRVITDDPLHDNGPVKFVTAAEVFDATNEAVAPGKIERLRDLAQTAIFHGQADTVAPIKDSFAAFRRIAGGDFDTYLKKRKRNGVKETHSPDGNRKFVQYDQVTHDIFEGSEGVIPDIIETLDEWVPRAKAEDVFVDDRLIPVEDILVFGWWLMSHALSTLWETKYHVRYWWRHVRRVFSREKK